jgi:cytochrome P450
MTNAPVTHINPADFAADPYPTLSEMRRKAPITYVPELRATLITRRDDIHVQEKRTDLFSSHQPNGLMTRLMGTNMMRKDGDAHMAERRALFPALSPKTVQAYWLAQFETETRTILKGLKPKSNCDLVTDFAMPVSAQALKAITGLTDMRAPEMDGVSQAMIDGCSNYVGQQDIENACHAATALIDAHIDRMLARGMDSADKSALAVLHGAGLPMDSIRANIKLIISGGQNEPRDAIAGTMAALLQNPGQLQQINDGKATYLEAFLEYARWMSPIGMSPRRVDRDCVVNDISFAKDSLVFLMFSSAGRDEDYFDNANDFDIKRDTQPSIPFGAGPHFCAGAAAARALITQVALPMAFTTLPGLHLTGPVRYHGWAFRGPVSVPVAWTTS